MGVEIDMTYQGDLRCVATHGPSSSQLETDAPRDNCGKGERFSPTDLVATALATCIATTVGILAQRNGWDLRGMRIRVTKEMSGSGPRRIVRLPAEVWMPPVADAAARGQIEETARNCPVYKSISPDIETPCQIHWPD